MLRLGAKFENEEEVILMQCRQNRAGLILGGKMLLCFLDGGAKAEIYRPDNLKGPVDSEKPSDHRTP
jgi:hypothetical protein